MPNIQDTIDTRETSYGLFATNAWISQRIKAAMHDSPNWKRIEEDKTEALEIIASKIGRLLSGDHNHIDSWHDIAGYATLVENRLRKENESNSSRA